MALSTRVSFQPAHELHTPTIFAHRGLNTLAPENTFSAFRAAHEHGVKWLETDVDVIADGTVIICHDTTLDRTTNAHGGYYELTERDIAHIDAGSWFDPAFAGEPLPTLHHFVDFLNETGMNCNIELKGNEHSADMSMLLLRSLVTELARLQPGISIIISSFSHVLLAKLHDMAPHLTLACLYETAALYDDWKAVLEMVGASYIHPENRGLTREKVRAFRDAGFGVNVWTVNSKQRVNELFNWGCTGVFTDIAHEFSLYR